MKKISFVFLALIIVSAALHADTVENPESTTVTAVTGISLDAQSSALHLKTDRIGISGLSFRFLDENREGIMVPVAFSYYDNVISDVKYSRTISCTINSGVNFINKRFSNQYISINSIMGFSIMYEYAWIKQSYYSDTLNRFSAGFGVLGGLEIEVPIGRMFSIPNDMICISSGFTVTGKAVYTEELLTGYERIFRRSVNFAISANSYGTGISTVALRYYF